jgi:hypothetical protein
VTQAHAAKGYLMNGTERPDLKPTWRSSNPEHRHRRPLRQRAGPRGRRGDDHRFRGGMTAEKKHTVLANPVRTIELSLRDTTIRTGDVIHLTATGKAGNGQAVANAPMVWSYTYVPDDSLVSGGLPGGAGIVQFGEFAGNYPGKYTLMARSGTAYAETTIEVRPREARRRIQITGRGNINQVHTSDLWPWTGKDGGLRLVGTWGGDGWAYVFDITDLNNPVKTDSVQVDARTINDVTVSPDGRYGALSREGASNRINGVVILDLATPAHPRWPRRSARSSPAACTTCSPPTTTCSRSRAAPSTSSST